MASAKGALTSTDPSIRASPAKSASASRPGSRRRRNGSRPGHGRPRSSARRSSSATCSAGKAPGKLAVARAAKTSSSGLARAPPGAAGVGARNPIETRCSGSSTRAGECSVIVSAWPLKSVAVTNRSNGWPAGSRGAAPVVRAMASSASAIRRENPIPPNGASNQRERIRRDSLARTSDRVSGATLSATTLPGRFSANQISGAAQNLAKRQPGLADGSSSTSTSALSSHKPVSGSSDCPEWIAWARNTPLIPPALAPATMSARTRRRSPCRVSRCSSKAR